ncbi:MAG TPA: cytochrome P450 [Actinophytocola sp.]|uniref:cytochrome P450 n=1 Tax=Actinophytocola sp. TaxID=1872138 RepID=UPI002DBFD1D5|nr:cytochrome P450 [Actinophytocola sp.]HEU5473235.1 cytochrome P450 [Actinophytocola sp.]
MDATPGPRGRAALALLPRLQRDPLGLLTSLMAEYGDRVRVPSVGGHLVFVLARPDDVAHVLVANQGNYVKAPTYRPLKELLGDGLLTNEGDGWARQRRLVQPMFARRNLLGFGPAMLGAAADMLSGWAAAPPDTVFDMAGQMSALTLDVVGRTLFSSDLTGEAGGMAPALETVLVAYMRVVRNPLFWLVPNFERWPTPSRRRAWRAETHLREVVDRIIAARRAEPPVDRPADLLDMLLSARDESPAAEPARPRGDGDMTEQQVRDELMTFMLAGHETTANALAWTLFLLSTHPEARDRLAAEVDEVLAGRPPATEDADKLEWTSAVVSESMRLYPPAWIIERQPVADDALGSLRIPPGSIVITAPYLVHRNPEHWPNPEVFDPGRFLPAASAGRHRFAYLPFGGGRRQCVGSGFATLEAILLLAAITQRFRCDLVPGARPVPRPSVTLRPDGAIPMTVHPR